MRICMIAHSEYETDNRVRRYAETLAQRGDSVEVFVARRSPNTPAVQEIAGVKVFRIQDRSDSVYRSKFSVLFPLIRFLLVSAWEVTRRHWRNPYDVIHVHNIPDFLVFAAWYPKLTGATVLLDIHDLVPELFEDSYRVSSRSVPVRTLRFIERWSARFADHVIVANHLWLEKYTSRSASADKCSVFINHVDTGIFRARRSTEFNDRPVVLFPGSLQWHQGLDIAIRAFAKLRRRMPGVEFHIYGYGPMKATLIALANELGLDGNLRFFEPLSLDEISAVMAKADLGVVPKRADTFGNEAYSTKILEFMAVGVPVVVSSTKIDRHYFNDSVVRFFPAGDVDAMADGMYEVLSNRELRQRLIAAGFEYALRNSWATRKAEYLNLIDSLRARRAPLKVAV
jgi:glycosyltransferase involved in cell wall biosynthesis